MNEPLQRLLTLLALPPRVSELHRTSVPALQTQTVESNAAQSEARSAVPCACADPRLTAAKAETGCCGAE